MRIFGLEYTATIEKYTDCFPEFKLQSGTRLVYSEHFNFYFKPIEGAAFKIKTIMTDPYRYRGNSVGEIIALFRDDVSKRNDILRTKGFYLNHFHFSESYTIKPDFSDLPTITIKGDKHEIEQSPEQEPLIRILEEEYAGGSLDFEEFTDAVLKLDCIDLERKTISDLPNVGSVRLNALLTAGYASMQDIANAEPENIREKIKISEKHAKTMIATANHWLEAIHDHHIEITAYHEFFDRLRQSNKIVNMLNNLYKCYNRSTVNGSIFGIICCDEGGKVLAVNKNFNPDIDLWQLGSESVAVQNISLLFQNSVIKSVQSDGIVVFSHGQTSIYIKVLKSQDVTHFLLLSVIGTGIEYPILKPLLEKQNEVFKINCQNDEELTEIINSARSTIKEYITQIKNKYIKLGSALSASLPQVPR